jgi:curli production assembly/transport component CsgG
MFDGGYATLDLNAELILLPKDKLTPYVFAGGGYGFNSVVENLHAKIQYGAGLEFMVSNVVLNFMENTILILAIILIISKEVRDDYYYRFDWYNVLL